jgi:hypothetical protein
MAALVVADDLFWSSLIEHGQSRNFLLDRRTRARSVSVSDWAAPFPLSTSAISASCSPGGRPFAWPVSVPSDATQIRVLIVAITASLFLITIGQPYLFTHASRSLRLAIVSLHRGGSYRSWSCFSRCLSAFLSSLSSPAFQHDEQTKAHDRRERYV